MATRQIKLHSSWLEPLRTEFEQPYISELRQFLLAERKQDRTIFPQPANWFRALDLTPLDNVRVVILGQDPYHGPGQAHGLCFSVPPGVRPPPSLVNIFKELESDLGVRPSPHGFLEHWARQGVLLLNSVLTVGMGSAASHRDRGWERFTDAVVRLVNQREEPVAFLLWGSYAQKKAGFVDTDRHLVLKAPHPSPLSAHNGFFGCRHFSKTNAFLQQRGLEPIDWALPEIQAPSSLRGAKRGSNPATQVLDCFASLAMTVKSRQMETRHLGKTSALPSSPDEAVLDYVPNPRPKELYLVRFAAPEFTSLCPVTGQPDFAHLVIDYAPGETIVESKSLKLFLASFRNHCGFHEDVTVGIGQRLYDEMKPRWLRIGGYWYPRGGIPIDVFWQSGPPPDGLWIPDQGVAPYRGRG